MEGEEGRGWEGRSREGGIVILCRGSGFENISMLVVISA